MISCQKPRSALPQSERDMLHQNAAGLLLYCDSDDFGRCFVPQHARKSLVLMAHRRLMHLQHGKVYAHLAKYYWWPRMRSEVKAQVDGCQECQLERAKRHKAHKLWRSMSLAMPADFTSKMAVSLVRPILMTASKTKTILVTNSFCSSGM